MKVGYARVSTTGQSLDIQLEALKSNGCEELFQETESGKSADNREQLKTALQFVRKGDALVVTKLDRLARSMVDLGNIADTLKIKGADLIVLGQGGIDTTTSTGMLMFNMLGSFAQFERDLILERTAEGRAKAKAKGVKFGRKVKLDDIKLQEAIAEYKQRNLSASEVARKHGISRSSLYRLMQTIDPS